MVKSKTLKYFIHLIGIIIITCLFFKTGVAQERNIQGIVFDKESKSRLSKVKIFVINNSSAIYNNSKGEFSINIKNGDVVVCSLEGYYNDSTKITTNTNSIIFLLKRKSILLPQVTIKDSTLSAEEKYAELKKQFNNLHRLGNNKDLFSISNGGVGLSIDALWSAFSREGKNARRLQEVMERDYRDELVEARFNAFIVQKTTGLHDDNLYVFIQKFKPSFYFAAKATDYEMLNYIKLAHNKFRKSPYFRKIITDKNP